MSFVQKNYKNGDTLYASDLNNLVLGIVEANANIANKANLSEVYTTEQTDEKLAVKANSADVYSIETMNGLLAEKANVADVYTKTEVDAKLVSALRYKGSVATEADLPEDAEIGDVYNVEDTGANYAWNGTAWDNLGSSVDLSSYLTIDSAAQTYLTKVDAQSQYATKSEVVNQLAEKQPVGDYPIYQEFVAGASDKQRKTIQLANADSISGISTTGTGANLIMMSQWDKVDIGTTKYQMNLNSPDGVVQINDEKVVATTDQIEALGVHSLGNFSSSGQAEAQATTDGVFNNPAYNVLVYTVNGENGQIINSVGASQTKQFLYWQGKRYTRTVAKVGEEVQASAWASDDGYVALPNRAVMPTLFTLTTEADSDTVKAALTSTQSNEPITLDDLNKCLQTGYVLRYYSMQSGSVFVGFNGQAFTLTYIGFANPTQDPAVMSICVNVTAEGVYSVTRNGTRGILLTSKTLAQSSVITALDGRVAALETSVSNTATKTELQEVEAKIPSVEGFATTEQLAAKADATTVETLASDLNNISTVIIPEMNTNTAKALDAKVSWDQEKKVISLPKDGCISAMRGDPVQGTQPEGGNLLAQRTYDEGATYVTEVGTTKNKLTLNATDRPQIDLKDADSEKVAYLSEIEAIQDLLPVMIQIPIRTLQDKVYDQATIFGWFGVEDIAGLRGLFSSQHLIWLRYGISSMGVGHMMYRFVVEYAEVNSDGNTIKLVFSGLNTQNDKLAKYEFTAKLDGAIVEGNSNVQLVVTDQES